MPAASVRGLTKRFGTTAAVTDLSFELQPGRILGFLGPNGSGKTTTLRMMLGLVRPSAGVATVNGRRYDELANPLHEVGAVLEASSFHPTRRAAEHLRIQAIAGHIARSRVDEVLGLVGLSDVARKRVKKYSLGMRQRLAVATALLGDPGILLFDEPANGLDPQGIHWLRSLMRHFANEGRCVLVSSHQLSEIAQSVDDVVIISRGRLVLAGPLSDVTSRATASIRVRTPQAGELAGLLTAAGIPATACDGAVSAAGATPEVVGRLMADHRIVVHEMVQERANLEEVFLSLTATDYLAGGVVAGGVVAGGAVAGGVVAGGAVAGGAVAGGAVAGGVDAGGGPG